MDPFRTLAERELLIVTGKGGVGKSTVAALLGDLFRSRGRTVMVLEADPRESLHQLYGVPPSGGDVVRIAPGLAIENVEAKKVLERLVRDHVPLKAMAERAIASPVYQHFTEGAPGLKEMAVLGHAVRLLEGAAPAGGETPDLLILDAPATGHGLSLLRAPRLVAESITTGPIGAMARRVAELVSDPTRTGVVVVTLAEAMPVDETLELRRDLDDQTGLEPELLLVNGLYPATDDAGEAVDALDRLWRQRRRVNELQLDRLDRHWEGPRLELPLVPTDRSPALLQALTEALPQGVTA